ncbi:MAG: porin family protein [Bacteroidia bacterium]
MKKVIIILFTFLSSFNLFGQSKEASFTIGVMGMGKNTWLLNKNIFDRPNSEQEVEASLGTSFGINMSIYFTQNVGIGLDVLYATHNQKFNGTTDILTKTPYNSKIHFSSIDIPLYLRLSTNGGAYFELGSYFSMITGADYSQESSLSIFNGSKDIKAFTSGFNAAPLLGLGIDINLTDNLILSPGLRFSYGLSDVAGVDGQGVELTNTFTYISLLRI